MQAREKTSRQIANMSGYIRENSGSIIRADQTDFLLNLPTPSPDDKATRLLKLIAKNHPDVGEPFDLERGIKLLPWLSHTWIKDADEFHYILWRILAKQKNFLEGGDSGSSSQFITPEGWAFLQALRENPSDGTDVFVAMWFNEKMNGVWTDAIYPAVVDSGYTPIRIDKHQHNNRIDDEIIVKIRESKFLVADFTGNRGGVYFEAGYALGLGKQVIWVVEATELDEIHFDTRQYSFIRWDRTNLPELRNGLRLRIEATIGKGPSPAPHQTAPSA
jgi:hypothetical protein